MLYDKIVSDIREKISKGELKIGDKLKSERILAEEYQVSRNVVREALKYLSQSGLIMIKPGKGAFVSELDEDNVLECMKACIINNECKDMLEILEVREIFELAAIRRIIGKISEESFDELEILYNRMQDNINNIVEYSKIDEQFHKTILDQVDNRVFRLLASSFYELTLKEIFNVMCMYPERIMIAQSDHRELIDALKQEDVESAIFLTKKHMKGLEFEIKKIHNE